MQRAAEIEPLVMMDLGSDAGEFTAMSVFFKGRMVETFAIPADLMRSRDSGEAERRAMLRRYADLCAEVWCRTQRGLAPAIAERVLRLNFNWTPGRELRGLHRTGQNNPRWLHNAVPKGEFIRAFGREAFAAIPNHLLFKRGRRRWVKRGAVDDMVWEIYQGVRQVPFVVVADGPGFFGDNVRLRTISWTEFAKQRGFA